MQQHLRNLWRRRKRRVYCCWAALLQLLKDKGHPLNTQLEEQIAKLVPNNISIESKLWETMSLHPLEDSLKQGSKKGCVSCGLHFLEAYNLLSVDETSGNKVEQSFYNHCKSSICSATKTQVHLAE